MTFNEYAKKEFEIYFQNQKPPKDEDEVKMRKHLEETIESIGMIVDQSIFDSRVLLTFIERMLKFRTFYPLTGAEDEWEEYKEFQNPNGVKAYINKRCPSVIKYTDVKGGVTCVDINALIFKDSKGEYYKDLNRAKIIEFPYNPPINPEEVLNEEAKTEEKN
jgi:hypothetical protein